MNTEGKSLELFFVDGRPDGMLTAEVFNWTGHVLRLPRTQIKDALARDEAGFTGVYILIGERDGESLAYIGESEDLAARLRSHTVNKEWWDTAVLITSSANNLHKAHVKYLESRLVEIAHSVGSVSLENGNLPPRSRLSEASNSNMESFLETLQMVLPAIRVDMFLDKSKERTSSHHQAAEDLPVFELVVPKHGTHATAELRDGELVVLQGSKAREKWVGPLDAKTHYFKIRKELEENGVLELHSNYMVFTKDFAFSSPSAAGAVVNGRSTNGRREWRLKSDARSYAEWEADQIRMEMG